MQNSYRLAARQALICRIAAVLFALAAVARVAAVVVPFAFGQSETTQFHCGGQGCASFARYELQLPEDERAAVTASEGAMTRFTAYVRQPWVRGLQLAINAGGAAPFVLLMAFVAVGVRQLAQPVPDAFARALPWLRFASFAALATAVAPPVADSLRAMLLLPGTPSGPSWYLALDVGALLTSLLLASAAFIVTWAIAAGDRARRDMADFV